jgi:Uncharacterised nucleotidyltransferase
MMPLDHDTSNLLRAVPGVRARADAGRITELAGRIRDWNSTIAGAQKHGVLPLLYSALVETAVEIPPDAMELMRRKFERNTFHCLANAAELLDVLRTFDAASVPAMPFKGVVLGSSVYRDFTLRPAGDLDLLIFRRDLKRATLILQQRGYELKTNVLADGSPQTKDYFEFHFERPSDGMVTELRWRLELIQPRFRQDLGMDWVWARRRTTMLAGAEVPTLDPVSTLLMLCMHGSKHVWSRLIWTCDVARLLEAEPGIDWEVSIREARRVGLWRSLALGVLLALRLVGARVPAEVVRRMEADSVAVQLAEFFAGNLLEAPGRMPLGRVPYNVQLLGWRDRAWMALSATSLSPNERDQAVLKLPKQLEALYYLIRPIRIILDRTGR